MMKIFYISYFFILFILISCTKKRVIVGRLYNPVTESPLKGVEFEIAKWTSFGISAWAPSKKKIAKTGKTDNDGRFEVSKWISKKSDFFFKLNLPEDYYPSWKTIKLIELEKQTELNLLFARTGKIDLYLNNSNCLNDQDKLTLIQTHDFFTIENIDDNDTLVLNGCFDWNRLKKRQPEGNHYFKSILVRNGIETVNFHQIYVYPDSIMQLQINY